MSAKRHSSSSRISNNTIISNDKLSHNEHTATIICDVVAPLIEYSFNLNSNYGQLMHDLLYHFAETTAFGKVFNERCKALNF